MLSICIQKVQCCVMLYISANIVYTHLKYLFKDQFNLYLLLLAIIFLFFAFCSSSSLYISLFFYPSLSTFFCVDFQSFFFLCVRCLAFHPATQQRNKCLLRYHQNQKLKSPHEHNIVAWPVCVLLPSESQLKSIRLRHIQY